MIDTLRALWAAVSDMSTPSRNPYNIGLSDALMCIEAGGFGPGTSTAADEIERLRAALADTFALMDEGWLVRDTKNDAAPDWAIKHLGFVSRLARAHAALAGPAEEDRGS